MLGRSRYLVRLRQGAIDRMVRLIIILLLLAPPASALALTTSSPCERTQVNMLALETAITLFRADLGRLPTRDEGLSVLHVRPSSEGPWSGPYLNNTLTDYWGAEYGFLTDGNEYLIYSFGKDGVDDSGQGDDITSKGGFNRALYLEECTDWPRRRQNLRMQGLAGLLMLFLLP